MSENKYNYQAKFKQPQIVVGIKLDPNGGTLSERNLKDLKKDTYGASLLDSGLLIVSEITANATPDPELETETEIIPDFDETETGEN